jgi:hypothetical protein
LTAGRFFFDAVSACAEMLVVLRARTSNSPITLFILHFLSDGVSRVGKSLVSTGPSVA